MLTRNEVKWLKNQYPSIKIDLEKSFIQGSIYFSSAYDSVKGDFFPHFYTENSRIGFDVRCGDANIIIQVPKIRQEFFKLKIIHINNENIKAVPDRHIYNTGYACVCGVVEERIFIEQGRSLIVYFEDMVLPFLYGQEYYTKNGRWPWIDYSHGVLGILESYHRNDLQYGKEEIHNSLFEKVKSPQNASLDAVKNILNNVASPSRTQRCMSDSCRVNSIMRKCHPDALKGLKKLHRDYNGTSTI